MLEQYSLGIVCLAAALAGAVITGKSYSAAYWCCVGLLYVTIFVVIDSRSPDIVGSVRLLAEVVCVVASSTDGHWSAA